MVMNRHLCVFLVALGLVSGGCSAPAAKSNPDADRAAINSVRDQFIAAYKGADADRIAGLYAANAVAMPGDQPTLNGRNEIAKHERDQFSQASVGDVQIKSDEMQLMGDFAFDRGTFSVSMMPKTAGATPIMQTGRYLVILQRQGDGSWKVIEDIDNNAAAPMPPPMPPAPPKPPVPNK
jgi:uncharacterized protein (TIGR02246 family)